MAIMVSLYLRGCLLKKLNAPSGTQNFHLFRPTPYYSNRGPLGSQLTLIKLMKLSLSVSVMQSVMITEIIISPYLPLPTHP